MGDRFYDAIVTLGRPVFWVSGRPTVIDAVTTDRSGPFILASNHTSPFDVPLLMYHSRRRIDFVSITEVFSRAFPRWFYGHMNAFPLERSRPDAPAVRMILDRLARGRVIGMFPEGGFRRGEASVIRSRKIRPGIGRIALTANVPIVPAVVEGAGLFANATSWLPVQQTRYGVAFGKAIDPMGTAEEIEARLIDAMVDLHARLIATGKVVITSG